MRNRRFSIGLVNVLAILSGMEFMAAIGAAAQTETVIHTFQASSSRDGSEPYSGLIADGQGALYGTTRFGGKYGFGSVYKLSQQAGTWKENVLYSFSGGADGANPFYGNLILKNGSLYGAAAHGGASGYGVVYKLSPGQPWQESVLHSFNGTDGNSPTSGVTLAPGGVLYGVTAAGGADNLGVVYSLAPQVGGTWTESTVYSFTGGNDGYDPYFGVTLDAHGALYGTTLGGGGSGNVFKLIPHPGAPWTEATLYFFNGDAGGYPNSSLIFDSAGSLYGAVAANGVGNSYVFQLNPPSSGSGSWTENTLHSFTGSPNDGEQPNGVIFDSTGALYGTTSDGGEFGTCCNGYGTVFKLTPPSAQGSPWNEAMLYSFQAGSDGQGPNSSLVQVGGTFYGTTVIGGTPNVGTVFSFTP